MPRPGSTAILPRIEWERRSISAASSASGRAATRVGLVGVEHEDEARARPGQRHQRERPGSVWNSVEMSSCGRVWREIKRERGLRIAPAFGLDAGRRAAERAAAVGADRERGA